MSRPKSDNPKSIMKPVRWRPADLELIEQAAKITGQSVSGFIRGAALSQGAAIVQKRKGKSCER